MIDGIPNHPNALDGCPICHGGGLLDDGDTAPAAMLVPCLCTGKCPPDAAARARASYPNECRRLAELAELGDRFEHRRHFPPNALAKLEAIAVAAPPGPWRVSGPLTQMNAFIETFDRETCLNLICRIRRLESEARNK